MKELNNSGMVEVYNHQCLWDNRQHPRIHDAFVDIWDQEELWVTIDRANLNPPNRQARGSRVAPLRGLPGMTWKRMRDRDDSYLASLSSSFKISSPMRVVETLVAPVAMMSPVRKPAATTFFAARSSRSADEPRSKE
jgi:hypothetical protein